MAMLAGPRRKQKVINLRAKNNAWSNDTNKFGQRLLEKMGWSAGKGLGANENGIVEHVVARYKNDDRGLGFEDRNDQWTKHEDDFNALLTNLSNASGGDNDKLHSGVSLEVKSKKSKARVHYHKFTRGKDLTRYSDKDLANIFGKKSLKEKDVQEIDYDVKDDVKTTEQIFTEKGSMEDYFKNKLTNFKTKSKLLSQNREIEEDDADYTFKGFSNNSDENETSEKPNGYGCSFHASSSDFKIKNVCSDNKHINEGLGNTKSKKKKKDKNLSSENLENNLQSHNELDQQITTATVHVTSDSIKKNKKSKKINNTEHVYENSKPLKKKIKSSEDQPVQSSEQNNEVYVPKKKKKKNKDKEI